jgi:hypothetical protein
MRVESWCSTEELGVLLAKTKNADQRQRLRVIRGALEGLILRKADSTES